MSSRAVARQRGNRGAGRTRFPSVNALSEFSHNQGQLRSILPTAQHFESMSAYVDTRHAVSGLKTGGSVPLRDQIAAVTSHQPTHPPYHNQLPSFTGRSRQHKRGNQAQGNALSSNH